MFYLTLQPHERETVSAWFGEGRQTPYVPPFQLWIASLRTGVELPNGSIYPTDSSGSLAVTISVIDTSSNDPNVQPLGSAKLELPLKPHWLWWVTSRVAPRRDRESDEFMRGPPPRSVAIALSAGDSLYVTAYGAVRRCELYLN